MSAPAGGTPAAPPPPPSPRRDPVAFYEDRYAHGYLDEWPADKQRRVLEVVRALPLPDKGAALDFGCGNGIFTDVLRQALPRGWSVWGADISERAIANAQRRHPECRFHPLGHPELAGRTFDLVFTHHVLEHVQSLAGALDTLDAFLHDGSTALHILPCGNAGSFEHALCRLREDGIETQAEHRFFFEDHSHLRRLTTEQLVSLCDARGLRLTSEFYANQHHGAIDWITRADVTFLRRLTDPATARDAKARGALRALRRKLLLLRVARYSAGLIDQKLGRGSGRGAGLTRLVLAALLYPISKPIDAYLSRKADEEWRRRRDDRAGSEMYLTFTRGPGIRR